MRFFLGTRAFPQWGIINEREQAVYSEKSALFIINITRCIKSYPSLKVNSSFSFSERIESRYVSSDADNQAIKTYNHRRIILSPQDDTVFGVRTPMIKLSW